jgi:amino acid transporter
MSNRAAAESHPAHLKRALRLWHIVIYGVIIIQPTAPMAVYGVVNNIARGHVVTTILIAMVAMLFTAISYGRMARVYPSAGSAYTYVGRTLHPALGFLVGWSMLMDYILNPIICAIWCSASAQTAIPQVPYFAWVIAFVALFTSLNLRGVQTSARVNAWLAFFMSLVVATFLAYAARYIHHVIHPVGSQWLLPFYNPATFASSSLFRGTSVAVLTYIGFDAISTLSEEVENPRRNILLATVLTCVVIGLLSAVEVYAAQLASPYRGQLSEALADTEYVHVALLVGGKFLFFLVNTTLLIATAGSGTAAQAGAARLLYGMGRGKALPDFFAAIDPRSSIPRNNVLVVGACTLAGAFLLTYSAGAELLNFGAFIAFMGVNLAAFVHYKIRRKEHAPFPGIAPLLGFLISTFIWINLGHKAQLLGLLWLLCGLVLYLVRRRHNKAMQFASPEFE